jgi:predicted transcriptional regulator YheO
MIKKPTVDTVKPQWRPRKGPLPAAVAQERAALLAALQPVVQMLGAMVGPNIEVLLHDLTRPESSIVAIEHGHVSNRGVGGSIISGPRDDVGFYEAQRQLSVKGKGEHSAILDYPTVTDGGLRLRSSTVLFRDSLGEPYAALCLNADMSMFEATHAWLEGFMRAPSASAKATPPQADMDTLMLEIINGAVRRFGKPVSMMNKDEKTQAVQAMLQRGLFIVKGGVELAAQALGVSRFTIYNYMEAIRERGVADEASFPKNMTRGSKRAETAS